MEIEMKAGAGAAAARGADYKADDEEMQVGAGAEDEVFSSIAKPKESASAIVSVRNVHKTYLLGIEGVPALRGVTIEVPRGDLVVVLGKSGSGKTSFLNLLGTIDQPTRGDLRVADQRITAKSTDRQLALLRLHRLGFVFQTFNLLPGLTAQENVELPMVLKGQLTRAARRERAEALLRRVGMGARLTHMPSMLSGGEQQRVTIARALSNQPDLLLLDEPTGDLDTRNSAIVMNLLMELNERDGVSMVMVTHDVALKMLAHRVVHMLDGKVQRVETIPEEVRVNARRQLAEQVASAAPETKQAAAVAPRSIHDCTSTSMRRSTHYGRLLTPTAAPAGAAAAAAAAE